jgi:osmotically-inducible protein OsmY
MKEKKMYRIALMVVVTTLLLMTSVPVFATETETDEAIESSASNSYVFREYLRDDAVTVKSMNGVVTLTGAVSQESHKSLAQETVANLPGVKSVDNQLEVKGEKADENSDIWITMKVKAVLLLNRHVSAMTEVNTKDGIVTLRGNADSQAQKDLTTEFVKDVDVVKDVQNEMTVASESMKTDEQPMDQQVSEMGDAIDDASITALVKMTLLYHRSTSALNTKVETSNGQVTLTGAAKNAAEKVLVTKYVQDVHGVNNVVNNMIIDAPASN